jgi:hypothetical protein
MVGAIEREKNMFDHTALGFSGAFLSACLSLMTAGEQATTLQAENPWSQ